MGKRVPRGRTAVTSKTNLVLCGQSIDVAYFVPTAQPAANGDWRGEPDKLAWVDPHTGYPCIIRRERKGGHLGFYVGLPLSHPLHGWNADAIPSDLVDVPGGLDYSAACDARGPEERSICHVHSLSTADDLWWVGAECNRIGDLKPDDKRHADEAQRLGLAQTYRTPAEVFARCRDLAAQLKSLEDQEAGR